MILRTKTPLIEEVLKVMVLVETAPMVMAPMVMAPALQTATIIVAVHPMCIRLPAT